MSDDRIPLRHAIATLEQLAERVELDGDAIEVKPAGSLSCWLRMSR
jgi:hypothetical protein